MTKINGPSAHRISALNAGMDKAATARTTLVQSGEKTLAHVAQRLKVATPDLQKANPQVKVAQELKVGQELRMPDVCRTPAPPPDTAMTEADPSLAKGDKQMLGGLMRERLGGLRTPDSRIPDPSDMPREDPSMQDEAGLNYNPGPTYGGNVGGSSRAPTTPPQDNTPRDTPQDATPLDSDKPKPDELRGFDLSRQGLTPRVGEQEHQVPETPTRPDTEHGIGHKQHRLVDPTPGPDTQGTDTDEEGPRFRDPRLGKHVPRNPGELDPEQPPPPKPNVAPGPSLSQVAFSPVPGEDPPDDPRFSGQVDFPGPRPSGPKEGGPSGPEEIG
jgi:hypothetical protein